MKKGSPRSWLKYIGLTAQLLALILFSVYAGLWLDKKLQVSPLFLIVLPLAVLGGAFYNLYKETNKKNPDE
ncbi:AtpZ/AtpI family protein [Niabella soli]|uniref:AtpZ protein n=1 Tax=Niabella soli DSM 19437 TaxID=929713 RepID=W0EYT7_9BACT|nr:AtpZ/AtpI family protein [Niabella soli]AHF14364.1 AtpZ protein [Niabella soli DSM 19437]